MAYKFSTEAKLDLEKIWLYTFENWSFEQADKYVDLIISEILYVSKHQETGSDFSFIKKGYFRTKVKSHLIFFKKSVNSKSIEVIRILHQEMDIENRLT